jgi:hypothetical protein
LVTFSELRAAQPQLWKTAADDLRNAAAQCQRVEDDIHKNGVQPLHTDWPDHVGKLASGVLKRIAERAQVSSILARAGVEPVDALSHAVTIAQNELENGVRFAESNGLVVNPQSGSVSLPPTVQGRDPMELMLLAGQAQQLIDDAVEAATQADSICADELRTIAARESDPQTTVDQAKETQATAANKSLEEIRDTIPDGLSPTEVQQWWNGLTPQEQFDLQRACPTELMGLDGIPASVKQQIDRPQLGYSSAGAVNYAKQNVDNSSLDWDPEDNCTNFVSDALKYGGGMKTKDSDTWPVNHWDHDGWSDGGLGGDDALPPQVPGYSPSWGAAQNNHDFFLNHGGSVVSDPSQVRPGDIAYWQRAESGEVHHAAVVTGVLPDGEVLYTQHSEPGLNYPLNGRLPEFEQSSGPQIIQIVQPRVTW